MRKIMLSLSQVSFLLASLIATASFASAAITNLELPQRFKASMEEQIIYGAQEQISYNFQCDESVIEEINVVNPTVVESRLVPQEDASYVGELQMFVLTVEGVLPVNKCAQNGRYSCKMTYDLYDENAYDVSNESVECKLNGSL